MPFFYRQPDPSSSQDGSSVPAQKPGFAPTPVAPGFVPGAEIGPSAAPAPALTPAQETTERLVAAISAAENVGDMNVYNAPGRILNAAAAVPADMANSLRATEAPGVISGAFKTVAQGALDTLSQIPAGVERMRRGVSEVPFAPEKAAVDLAAGAITGPAQATPLGAMIGVAFNSLMQPGTLTEPLVAGAMDIGKRVSAFVQDDIIGALSPDFKEMRQNLSQTDRDEWDTLVGSLFLAKLAHSAIKAGTPRSQAIAEIASSEAGRARRVPEALKGEYARGMREIHPDLHQALPAEHLAELNRATADYRLASEAGDRTAMGNALSRARSIIEAGRRAAPKYQDAGEAQARVRQFLEAKETAKADPALYEDLAVVDGAQEAGRSGSPTLRGIKGDSPDAMIVGMSLRRLANAGIIERMPSDLPGTVSFRFTPKAAPYLSRERLGVAATKGAQYGFKHYPIGLWNAAGRRPIDAMFQQDGRPAYQRDAAARYGRDLTAEPVQAEEAARIARELAPADVEVRVEPAIKTPTSEAAGEFRPGEKPSIAISASQARRTTAVHEVTHAAMESLWNHDRARYEAVFQAAAKDFGLTDRAVIEERLAEEAAYYFEHRRAKTPGLSGAVMDFIRRLYLVVRSKFSEIGRLYEDITTGKFAGKYATRAGKEFEKTNRAQEIGKEEARKAEETATPEEVAAYAQERGLTKPKGGKRAETAKTAEEPAKGAQKAEEAKPEPEPVPEREKVKNAAAIVAKAAAQSRRFPGVRAITNAIRDAGPGMFEKGLAYAARRGMIKPDQFRAMVAAYKRANAKSEMANRPGSGTTPKQRAAIVDMQGWNTAFKRAEDRKIDMERLGRGLRESGRVLRLVNPPDGARSPIPFSLMGNKSATMNAVLKPMFLKAIKGGARHYVEPYAGAGTVLNAAGDMFGAGLETMDLNHFDREKYLVQRALKSGEFSEPVTEVRAAWDEIIGLIADDLQSIPEVREIMEMTGQKPGTRGFANAAQLSFYPEYAKQFFAETPDTRLAMGGEVSGKFREWLVQKQQEAGLDRAEAEAAANGILDNPSLFEKRYPEISKKISDKLASYDDVDALGEDWRKAIRMTMARHLMQRGSSGQRIVSASSGFGSVWNVVEKMTKGFGNYADTFRKHGDKIRLHNMDGKDFIAKIAQEVPAGKTLAYLDPPYLRTTAVYVKNQPAEIQESLGQYADAGKLAEIFAPLKGAEAVLTNDIDGDYIAAVTKLWGDKMAPVQSESGKYARQNEVIGYREGTTPTSLIATNGANIGSKALGLTDYSVLRSARQRDAERALEDTLIPQVSEDLKKEVAKLGKAAIEDTAAAREQIVQAVREMDWTKAKFEELDEKLKGVASAAERAEIIRAARRIVKEGAARGEPALRIIELVTKRLDDVKAKRRELTDRYRALVSSPRFDARVRQQFEAAFHEAFTERKLSGLAQEYADLQARVENRIETPAELAKFMEMAEATDGNYADAVSEYAGQQSIWQMGMDGLAAVEDMIAGFEEKGSEMRRYEEFQHKSMVDKLASDLRASAHKADTPVRSPIPLNLRGTIRIGADVSAFGNRIIDTSKGIREEFMPSVWLAFKYGIQPIDRLLQTAEGESARAYKRIYDHLRTTVREAKLTPEGEMKVYLSGIASQKDPMVLPKVARALRIHGDPITGEKYATDAEAMDRARAYADAETMLTDAEMGVLREFRKVFKDERPGLSAYAAIYEGKGLRFVEDYFPIIADLRTARAAGDATRDFDADLNTSLGKWRREGVDAASTKARTTAAYPILMKGGLANAFRHIRDVQYQIHVGPALKAAGEAAKEAKDALGTHGVEVVRDMLDTYARRGVLGEAPTAIGKSIETLTRNATAAILSGAINSYLVQFSAIADVLAITGKIPMKPVLPGGAEWKSIHEKSAVLAFRDAGDLISEALTDEGWKELGEMIVREPDLGAKFRAVVKTLRKAGFAPFNVIDQLIGTAAWKMVYEDSIAAGMDEATSVYMADVAVRMSMASPRFNDNARGILRYKRGATAPLMVFQTFLMNKMAAITEGGSPMLRKRVADFLIRHGMDQARADRYVSKYMLAVWTALLMTLGAYLIEAYTKEGKEALVGGDPEKYAPSAEGYANSLVGLIPLVTTIAGQTRYGGPIWTSFATSLSRASDAFRKGDTERAAAHSMVSLSQAFGLPTTNLMKWSLSEELAAPRSTGFKAASVGAGARGRSFRVKRLSSKIRKAKRLRIPKLKAPKVPRLRIRRLRARKSI